MKNACIVVLGIALAAMTAAAWSQDSGSGSAAASGSGTGGTGVDSAVQSYGEGSAKTSHGLAAGLEEAFGGLTIEGGLAVGNHVAPDIALLGDADGDGDIILYTTADVGVPVKVRIHQTRIVSIERSGPIPVAVPRTYACG